MTTMNSSCMTARRLILPRLIWIWNPRTRRASARLAAAHSDARADLAAGFQAAVADVLADRASHAMAAFAATHPGRTLVVAGGVAANGALRRGLAQAAEAHGFRLLAPPPRLCGDNAVMVAWAGIERLRLGLTDGLDHAPRPRWPLDSLAPGAVAPAAAPG